MATATIKASVSCHCATIPAANRIPATATVRFCPTDHPAAAESSGRRASSSPVERLTKCSWKHWRTVRSMSIGVVVRRLSFVPGGKCARIRSPRLGTRGLAGRDDRHLAVNLHRHPALVEEHFGTKAAHEILVELGVQQVHERQPPLRPQRPLELEPVDAARGEQDLPDALGGFLLAPQRPAQGVAIDQTRGEKRLADRLGLLGGSGAIGPAPAGAGAVAAVRAADPRAVRWELRGPRLGPDRRSRHGNGSSTRVVFHP